MAERIEHAGHFGFHGTNDATEYEAFLTEIRLALILGATRKVSHQIPPGRKLGKGEFASKAT